MSKEIEGVTIFFKAGSRVKKTSWVGNSFAELERLYCEVFYEAEEREIPSTSLGRKAFYLKHKEFGVSYEGWEINEIYPGAVVDVKDPPALREAKLEEERHAVRYELDLSKPADEEASANEGNGEPGGEDVSSAAEGVPGPGAEAWGNKTAESPDRTNAAGTAPGGGDRSKDADEKVDEKGGAKAGWRKAGSGAAEKDGDKPAGAEGEEKKLRGLQLVRSKIWTLLDDPSSSKAAGLLTIFILILILFSTITFCLETLPYFYEPNTKKTSVWYILEAFCIAVFTFELVLRILTCPELGNFFKDAMNMIDIIAILPFYIELALEGVAIPGLAVFRAVRLVRVFRLFKVSRGSLTVFVTTMRKSAKPLYMLVFFTSIALIIFSSLMYYAERGTYNDEFGIWMRLYLYECEVVVKGDNPSLDSGLDEPCRYPAVQPEGLRAGETQLICPYNYRKPGGNCQEVKEQSPFESIPASFWWCLVTMTTVGYGDIGPTQWYGKLLGMFVMMCGILVIALPITVIGSNFATIYREFVLDDKGDEEEEEEEGMEGEALG